MFTIQQWLMKTFGSSQEPKVFLELGAHRGEDTLWMLCHVPNVCIHAFEPDPRNFAALAALENGNTPLGIIIPHEAAVSYRNSTALFVQSESFHREPWTFSSSLRKPKNHLRRFPGVKFGQSIYVRTVTLDSACAHIPQVNFIWCDIQGSEGDMVRGAAAILKRTHYLYTEYSDHEMYEGQPTLADLCVMLGAHWKILAQWQDDALLENTEFHPKEQAA